MKNRLWRSTLLLQFASLALLLGGCGKDQGGQSGNYPPALIPQPIEQLAQVEDKTIRVGDSLEIFVREDPSFDGIYRVREEGDIIIPRVGRILVAGQEVSSARDKISRVLEEGQLKKATLIVDRVSKAPGIGPNGSEGTIQETNSPRILVYMTGKVNRPGQHYISLTDGKPVGVYEALLIAGGISRFGDEKKVHILRKGNDGKKYRISVNIHQIQEGEIPDPPIGQGDIVVVPEKVFGY